MFSQASVILFRGGVSQHALGRPPGQTPLPPGQTPHRIYSPSLQCMLGYKHNTPTHPPTHPGGHRTVRILLHSCFFLNLPIVCLRPLYPEVWHLLLRGTLDPPLIFALSRNGDSISCYSTIYRYLQILLRRAYRISKTLVMQLYSLNVLLGNKRASESAAV